MKVKFNNPCLLLSGIAILISVVAMGRCWLRSPMGKGLAGYDFSTPKRACFSVEEMYLNHDWLAFSELCEGPMLKEYLKTLEVKKEVELEGRRILFVSFSLNGIKKFKTEELQKDAQTGLWFYHGVTDFLDGISFWNVLGNNNETFTRVSPIGSDGIYRDNRTELQKQIERWREKGEL